jgi:hypothetical protein
MRSRQIAFNSHSGDIIERQGRLGISVYANHG